MQLSEIIPGKPYACEFKITTFVDPTGVPIKAAPQVGQAHPGKPGIYESVGIIQVRDQKNQLVQLVDVKTETEFVVAWIDCWNVDHVEYTD
jgi:hypothetical protein